MVGKIGWDTRSILNTESINTPYALVVLNCPISFEPADFQRLWNRADIRVLVDGGANRWFKFIDENKLNDSMEKPHFSTGDMDSISEDSKQRLQAMDCEQIETPDQDETDCTKALMVIRSHFESKKIKIVQMLTSFGGRIDQTMSQINTLFQHPVPNDVNLYLRSHQTLAWLLQPGHHEIIAPEEYAAKQFWCSYVPMDGKCNVTTNGFKWDLTNAIVGFGGIVSSSNTYNSPTVEIQCDKHLLWSMGTCLS